MKTNCTNISRAAFSLIELLGTVAIIGILMGLAGSAAFAARQRAYTASATAETQQIAAAFRSYFIANRHWPSGFGSSAVKLTEDNLAPLLGKGNSSVVYLDIPPDHFEGGYLNDPWGNPYEVQLDDVDESSAEFIYEGTVSFPARFRYYCEDEIYLEDYKHNDRIWEP